MKKDYNIASVRKAFQIIDIMASKNGALSVSQLAEIMDVTPSNITRMLQTLCDVGYVEKNTKTNRYFISNKIYILTNTLLTGNEFLQRYRPLAYLIAEKYGVMVNLNTVYRKNAIMLIRVVSHYDRNLDFKIGDSTPAYCSSAGKAILSMYDHRELDDYFLDVDFIKYQPNTYANETEVRQALEKIRHAGYALDNEEYITGTSSISFPIQDKNRQRYAFTIIMQTRNRRSIVNKEVISYIQRKVSELTHFSL